MDLELPNPGPDEIIGEGEAINTVVVHPERCVGCMQCMAACAVAPSRAKTLYGAVGEVPTPAPRVHVGPGPGNLAVPNK